MSTVTEVDSEYPHLEGRSDPNVEEEVVSELDFVNRALVVQEKIISQFLGSKLAVGVQASLRKKVGDLVRIVVEQQEAILRYKIEKEKSKELTYAEKAKVGVSATGKDRARSRSRSRSRARQNYVVAVYPSGEETDSLKTKKKVQNLLDPNKIRISVNKVKNIRNGGILIETSQEEDIEKIVKEFEINEELKTEFKAEKPRKRKPHIIVYDVEEDLEQDILLENLRNKNDCFGETAFIDIKTSFKTRRGRNWIIEIDPESFEKLGERRKLNLGWARVDWKEYLKPRQCYRCWGYGHPSKYCRNQPLCISCGKEGHKGIDCQEQLSCVNCCKYNSRFKAHFDIGHRPNDNKCKVYEKEVNFLISRTDYGSIQS